MGGDFWAETTKLNVFLKQSLAPSLGGPLEKRAILDSGASSSISGHRADFRWVEPEPTVRISGVDGVLGDGRPRAFRAVFHKNSLFLRKGIFYPGLQSKRLVSMSDLLDAGWESTFKRGNSRLCRTKGGNTEFRTISFVGDEKMPEVPLCFYGDPGHAVRFPREGVNFLSPQDAELGLSYHTPIPDMVMNSESNPTSASSPKGIELGEAVQFFRATNKFVLNICAHFMEDGGTEQGANKRFTLKNLEIHRKLGHLSIPGVAVSCDECQRSKGSKSPHDKKRGDKYAFAPPFAQLSCDFMGPLSKGVSGDSIVLVVICDKIAYTFVQPLGSKADVYDAISDIIEKIRRRDARTLGEKIVRTIRSDNEPVLRSNKWEQMATKLGVEPQHTVPWSPQQNGVAERFMRTLAGALRAVLQQTDDNLWPYAVEYISYCWNRIPRNYPRFPQGNGHSPTDIRNALRDGRNITPKVPIKINPKKTALSYKKSRQAHASSEGCGNTNDETSGDVDNVLRTFFYRDVIPANFAGGGCVESQLVRLPTMVSSEMFLIAGVDHFEGSDGPEMVGASSLPNLKRFRRFGVLAYVQIEDRKDLKKLDDRFVLTVFLGFSRANSGWLFGTFKRNLRRLSGFEWREYETTSAKFTEIMCRSIEDFKDIEGEGVRVPKDDWDKFQELLECQKYPLGSVAREKLLPENGPEKTPYAHQSESEGVPKYEPICGNSDLGGTAAEVLGGFATHTTDGCAHSPLHPGQGTGKRSSEVDTLYGVKWGERREEWDETCEHDVLIDKKMENPNPRAEVKKLAKHTGKNTQVKKPVLSKNVINRGGLVHHYVFPFSMPEDHLGFEPSGDRGVQFNSNLHQISCGSSSTLVEANLSVAAALSSPNKEKWEAALSRELGKLMGAGTWADLTPDEAANSHKKVIPLAIILSEKRDGTHKARACVLGNRTAQEGIELYAPTIGMVALRMMLSEIANDGDYCVIFDLDCAFLNAPLKEEV